jgi:hypothetical protein
MKEDARLTSESNAKKGVDAVARRMSESGQDLAKLSSWRT